MQKVELNRMGKEPHYVEVPDDCTCFIDMRAKLGFKKMYDPLSKRYRQPVAQYFVFWEKNKEGKWVLHNEPLEQLIILGYLENPGFQDAIKMAEAERDKWRKEQEAKK
jgi:hypothetical protein